MGTGALADRLEGRPQPPFGIAGPAFGDAGAARIPVVDEDRGEPGVGVHGRRDPTDVPAIARGDQWQQADRGMFGRVDRARHISRPDAGPIQDPCGDRPPDGLRLELDRRKRQGDLVDDLTGRDQLPDETGDLVRHADATEVLVDVADR